MITIHSAKRRIELLLWLAICSLVTDIVYAQTAPSTNSPVSESPKMKADTPDQQLFFCTTRIEAKSADGKKSSVGTGFVFSHKIDEQRQALFIVTCRHVINGFASASFSFVESKDGKPNLGEKCEVTVPDLQSFAFYDPDPKIDVALIPLVPIIKHFELNGKKPFFRSLRKDLVPSQAQAEDLSAIQPVVFVGYPNGMRDEKNLLPIARRGFTASPYVVDFNGLPLFLIDANVFPGSSGSPVMVLDQGMYPTGNSIVGGSRTHFLGLVSLAYFQPVEGEIQFKPMPSQFVPVYTQQRFLNIGGVIKAKAILNTIEEFFKTHPIPSSKP
jgi:hypothetical protein